MTNRSSDGRDRRRDLLLRVPLFARLTAPQLDALAAAATTRRLDAREELFHKGDAAAQVYVIASGRLKVVSTSSEGSDVVLNLLAANEVVGELPLLVGGERTATVVALEATELVVLERREFLRFLREHPETTVELLTVLAERVVRLSECIEDIVFLGISGRIAKKLLVLAENFGEEEPDGVHVTLRLSQGELAQYVGTTRETVNKQIRIWTDQGVLSMAAGAITIHVRGELERLAGLVTS